MKKLIFFACCIVFNTLYAQSVHDSSALPLEQCNFQNVYNFLKGQSVHRSAEIATAMEPYINQYIKIIQKAEIEIQKKPENKNKPLDQLLNVDDTIDYTGIALRLRAQIYQLYIENRYERDLDVIKKLLLAANNLYQNRIPKKDDSDILYYATLILMRENKFNEVNQTSNLCSMQYALSNIEQQSYSVLLNSKVFNRIHEIAKKYTKFDINLLNDNEKQDLAIFRRSSLINEFNFIHDIENIKLLAKVSAFMYESYMRQLLLSGGNPNDLDNLKIEKQLSKDEVFALKFWVNVVDEHVPVEFIEDIKRIIKESEKSKR